MSSADRPLVVMGVSGVGKTTVGRLLAHRRGVDFIDADDLHGPANIAKMSAGVPLDDVDRWPWLDRVGAALTGGDGAVVACSALKRRYRDRLRVAAPSAIFVHLDAVAERIARQAIARDDHFMPPALLASQLAALEPLAEDEDGITVAVDDVPDAVVDRVERMLTPESASRGRAVQARGAASPVKIRS